MTILDTLQDHKQLDDILRFLVGNKDTRYDWRRLQKDLLADTDMEVIKLWMASLIEDDIVKSISCAGFGDDDDFYQIQGTSVTEKFLYNGGYRQQYANKYIQPRPKPNKKILQWILKWWWTVVVPLGIVVAGLAIENIWFK